MTLNVRLGDNGYGIIIERGALKYAKEMLGGHRRVMIVTDTGVPAQYADAVSSACRRAYTYILEQGEASKNGRELWSILSFMTDSGFDRGDCVVAVGGGACGDIAGFAAAVYMRGIAFYNIPTTLLSQVDSSVGGKTGIDAFGVKNVIGAFKQPEKVLIDPDVLSTLPKRQINNGLCEALKMAATSDPALFEIFERGDVYGSLDIIIERSLRVKISVVEADEREAGLRRVLNFGHTMAHAIEQETGYVRYNHGEAVAIGMCGAMDISRHLGLVDDATVQRVVNLIERLGLPTKAEGCTVDAMYAGIFHDKKTVNGKVNWVLADRIGHTIVKNDVPEDVVRVAMAGVLA